MAQKRQPYLPSDFGFRVFGKRFDEYTLEALESFITFNAALELVGASGQDSIEREQHKFILGSEVVHDDARCTPQFLSDRSNACAIQALAKDDSPGGITDLLAALFLFKPDRLHGSCCPWLPRLTFHIKDDTQNTIIITTVMSF